MCNSSPATCDSSTATRSSGAVIAAVFFYGLCCTQQRVARDRVCKSLGMQRPTAVQRGCIPAILGGRDVMGTAHTGSGKTAAFALPILQLLARDPFGVFALVLTPTRCSHPPGPAVLSFKVLSSCFPSLKFR